MGHSSISKYFEQIGGEYHPKHSSAKWETVTSCLTLLILYFHTCIVKEFLMPPMGMNYGVIGSIIYSFINLIVPSTDNWGSRIPFISLSHKSKWCCLFSVWTSLICFLPETDYKPTEGRLYDFVLPWWILSTQESVCHRVGLQSVAISRYKSVTNEPAVCWQRQKPTQPAFTSPSMGFKRDIHSVLKEA